MNVLNTLKHVSEVCSIFCATANCQAPLQTMERYAITPAEADHGRLKARLRPMRGLKREHSARTLTVSHAFVRNVRRGPL
jgi:hypothetical protein